MSQFFKAPHRPLCLAVAGLALGPVLLVGACESPSGLSDGPATATSTQPVATPTAVNPASPPSDLTTLLEYGNAAAASEDVFVPDTAQLGPGGADPNPDAADLVYQLSEATETAEQSSNPEAYWAVIDPSSGFYQHYDTGSGELVQFTIGDDYDPDEAPVAGHPRTYPVAIMAPSDTTDLGVQWDLTFTAEGPQGQWMVTAMSLAPTPQD